MNRYLYNNDEETVSPPAGILVANHFRRTYGFSGHRAQGTKDWLLIYTNAGAGSFRVRDEVEVCRSGDVAILPPGTPHHYAADEGEQWELLWVHFLPLPDWNKWLQLPRTKEQLIRLHVHEERTRQRIRSAFGRLIQDALIDDTAHRELAQLALAEILVLLHREYEEQTKQPHADERIAQVLVYLQEHFPHKLTLADAARQANLSESRLSHLFKEQTGETLMEMLVRLRLQHAAKLLTFTSRKIKEIAAEVGFESPYYFTRRFTEQFGLHPTAFRDRTRHK